MDISIFKLGGGGPEFTLIDKKQTEIEKLAYWYIG